MFTTVALWRICSKIRFCLRSYELLYLVIVCFGPKTCWS